MQFTLNDNTTMSVQASSSHYCTPRIDKAKAYTEVEIGFPSRKIQKLMPYAEDKSNPTGTVYGWVPTSLLAAIIRDAGGIKRIEIGSNGKIRLANVKLY